MMRLSRGLHPAFLILCLSILLVRNVPLCWVMPLWTFGDEMGHLDCLLKWSRGHVPRPMDRLEPVLFELNRTHRDYRYDSPLPVPRVISLDQLGVGGYSYEAKHPPLGYWIMIPFRALFEALGISLLIQVKLFRMLSLAAVAGGIAVLYAALRRNPGLGIVFYAPLLYISLLAQDMYFSVNTDVFSFFLGACALSGMIGVLGSPGSRRAWIRISLGTIGMMWTKLANAFVFAFWGILGWILAMKSDRRVRRLFAAGLFLSAVCSSVWMIYNQARYGNPFHLRYTFLANPPPYQPAGLSIQSAVEFLLAYTRTLFRGEMLWNGDYFNILSDPWGSVLLSYFPTLIFSLGLGWAVLRKRTEAGGSSLLLFASAGIVIPAGLAFGFFFIGGVPYYQARLSMAAFYPVLFVFGLGWRALTGSEKYGWLPPAALLLLYNAAHTLLMLRRVFG